MVLSASLGILSEHRAPPPLLREGPPGSAAP